MDRYTEITMCGLLVHFEGFAQVGIHPLGQSVPPSCGGPITKINASCGRRLQDVAASPQQGVEQPSELPMIGIVRREMEWHSRNNRRL